MRSSAASTSARLVARPARCRPAMQALRWARGGLWRRMSSPVLQRSIMDKVVMPVPTREEVRRGILYMILSVAVFALVNALVKYEEAVYPVSQVVFFRSIFALLF